VLDDLEQIEHAIELC